MTSLRKLFQSGKSREDSKFSARKQMVRAPPPGQVTDTDDPHHEVWKPQFSSGDQTDESRIPFFNTQPMSHFEARHWPRSVLKFPVTFMMMWADRHDLNMLKHHIFSKSLTGDCFLELYRSGRLASELQLRKKDLAKVTRALDDPRGALLNSGHR